jgi:type I restriction enzyme S subunit
MSSKTKTAATKEEARPALVPKLRFPEFRGAEAWEPKTLAEICLLITNGKANAQDHEEDGDYPLFDRSAVIKKSSEFMFDTEAVILPGEGMRFVPKYFRGKFNLHQRAYALMRHQGDGRFVYHSLDYFQEALAEKAVKSTVLSLRLPIVENFVIGCPKPAEQQKIAECLSSVDELIAAQARKVDALKTHKKGLMQQLFPREGETQPRLRFPEFQNAGDWEPKKLEDISHSVFDGTHQTPAYTPKGVPFYSVENLISGNANKFISHVDYLLATKKNRPEMGDILITRIGKIGHSQVVTWDHEFSVYVTLAVIKKSKAFNSHFLSHFMQSEFYQSELRAKSLPNAVPPKINLDSLRSTVVLLTNEAEQQRIAWCLSSLDALIAAETQKLDTLKIHKKGLMQQLFPSPEAVEA